MRTRVAAKVALTGLVIVGSVGLVVPPTWAATSLSTTVASASTAGPNAANTEVVASANCSGKLVSGGGTRVNVTTGTVPNGLKVDGTVPSKTGSTQDVNGDTSPTHWLGAGGGGGQAPTNAQTWAYALCIASGTGHGPPATVIAVHSASGPNTADTITKSTASCPTGTRLLSGGALTTPGTIGSLKIIGSFPSTSGGTPVTSGTNPGSWTAVGLNGGAGGTTNTTYAFAVCSTGTANPTVTVKNARVSGPTPASTGASVTISCGAGTVLVGGGAFISNNFGIPSSQGDHLTGSFPSTSAGTPVTSGTAAAWTASAHTGGQPSSGTVTDVWAICGSQTF